MKKLLIFCFLLGSGSIFLYHFSLYGLSSENDRAFYSGLSLEFFGGFVLAVAVYSIQIFDSSRREKEQKQRYLLQRKLYLENIIKHVFSRGVSSLNFRDEAPTFYFNQSRINQFNDLFSSNNRAWESFLIEYSETNLIRKKDKLMEKLMNLSLQTNKALVLAEKIDDDLIKTVLDPATAARMESDYLGDRDDAKKDYHFDFWVFRATLAEATRDEIFFGYAKYAGKSVTIPKIESSMAEITRFLKSNKEFGKKVGLLKENKKELIKLIKQIEKKLY